ncbi:MAG: pilus assembly protein PilM, partial [Oscillospiraceae bacterium]
MSQSKQELPFAPAELVFALDIGTHSVVGIVGKEVNNVFSVLALEEKAHTQRAMVDGQIEDIDEVSRVAKEVTQTLEKEISFRLQRVCVAAAGRTLVTQKGEWKKEIKDGTVIDEAIINEMETGAMQQAYEIMLEQATDKEQEFCCVGYSPLGYTLDDYKISKLNGHRGKKATVEVIATFLPQQVVDSLYRSMENIGLTVESLTLEPIAAMNAIIPNELRLLNLALVDIGAGTSDIAVSTGGAVSAYTMATIAGDELTEALVQEYLVDFNTAEKIKHGPQGGNDTLTFDDILGNEHTVDFKDIEKAISPVLDELSTVVSDKILEVNGKAPAAVFLVGGGSRAIGLCPRVADKLGLDITKVAVGSNNYMKKMISSQIDVYGPQFATPVGIALTAAQRRSKNSISVKVNGDKIALP